MAQEHGLKRDRGILVNIKLTHYEIASLIGSTRETTTVCLNDFKKEGLIDFDRFFKKNVIFVTYLTFFKSELLYF